MYGPDEEEADAVHARSSGHDGPRRALPGEIRLEEDPAFAEYLLASAARRRLYLTRPAYVRERYERDRAHRREQP